MMLQPPDSGSSAAGFLRPSCQRRHGHTPSISTSSEKPGRYLLTLAAGSILYVVIELLNVNREFGRKRLVTWGLLVGLLAGFLTDWILVAAGG